MSDLDDWTAIVCSALDIPVPVAGPVLDLARDVAHGVMRPAAPLTAYLVGVAVGRGVPADAAFSQVTALVEEWIASHGEAS
jgi:hypothetical protein